MHADSSESERASSTPWPVWFGAGGWTKLAPRFMLHPQGCQSLYILNTQPLLFQLPQGGATALVDNPLNAWDLPSPLLTMVMLNVDIYGHYLTHLPP